MKLLQQIHLEVGKSEGFYQPKVYLLINAEVTDKPLPAY